MKTKGKPQLSCFRELVMCCILRIAIAVLLAVMFFRDNQRKVETVQFALNRTCPANTIDVSEGSIGYDPVLNWHHDNASSYADPFNKENMTCHCG